MDSVNTTQRSYQDGTIRSQYNVQDRSVKLQKMSGQFQSLSVNSTDKDWKILEVLNV